MELYLGSCEYKWTHKDTHMERMWVQREVGADVYKTVEENGWDWVLKRSNSRSLPGDIYCRCDINVMMHESKAATHFILKHSEKVK